MNCAPINPQRGEKHYRAKLTDAEVREMRRLHHEAGKGYRMLGEIFGCSPWTARDIVTYRTRICA